MWCGIWLYACCLDVLFFFFQAEDGIRDLVRSRGLGDVYKRQAQQVLEVLGVELMRQCGRADKIDKGDRHLAPATACLLYTSDAADERSSVDLGGRRIIKKKKQQNSE